MKNKLKKTGLKVVAALILLTVSQFTITQSVLAAQGTKVLSPSSLSTFQTIGYFILVVAVIVLPAFRYSRRASK